MIKKNIFIYIYIARMLFLKKQNYFLLIFLCKWRRKNLTKLLGRRVRYKEQFFPDDWMDQTQVHVTPIYRYTSLQVISYRCTGYFIRVYRLFHTGTPVISYRYTVFFFIPVYRLFYTVISVIFFGYTGYFISVTYNHAIRVVVVKIKTKRLFFLL